GLEHRDPQVLYIDEARDAAPQRLADGRRRRQDVGRHGEIAHRLLPRPQDRRQQDDAQIGIAEARHRSTPPWALKWRRMRPTNDPNAAVFITSSERGRGMSTATVSAMRPGRGVITRTRSARNTASGIE